MAEQAAATSNDGRREGRLDPRRLEALRAAIDMAPATLHVPTRLAAEVHGV